MTNNSILDGFLNMIGITSVPTTVQELLWDIVLIVIFFFVVKYSMIFILTLMKEMVKMRA